ncbi:hypothetical protein GOP47_0001873 [Adiantum capillus-veneris]|uniref:Phospholipid/glycerol acyltransferase domain-containing protein n=1 Tax=Adiantum capillus-veneris TaxID=13818 RepID=A0A9D4V9V1_ADICA|nr:hypothetical protein GOP47_0001873 [Adiantum capillus-veneris]
MLFPEGTTTNGFYILPFKTGAFLAGTLVRPVILKYSYKRFSPAWDSISGVRHFILLLCQFINFLEGGLLKSDIGLKEKRIYHSFLNEYMALKGAA